MPSNLIQKSVRLPADMVDYIEEQEGYTFSEKLIGILEDCRNGDQKRQQLLARYNDQLQSRQERLDELTDMIYEASDVLRSCGTVIKKAKIVIEEYDT